MKQWRMYFFASVGSVLTVLQIILCFFLYNEAGLEVLRYVGWAILAVSGFFGWMPIFILRRKGGVAKGKSYVHTTVLVDSGIYAVVRHPQSGLAWVLLNLALPLIGQHWLLGVIGVASMVSAYVDTRQEDKRLVEKFGDAYERYMQSVPSINVLAGVIRLVRRRKRG
jgi:protein-S-isoprenylcysteine O-methyltransferase Ste14